MSTRRKSKRPGEMAFNKPPRPEDVPFIPTPKDMAKATAPQGPRVAAWAVTGVPLDFNGLEMPRKLVAGCYGSRAAAEACMTKAVEYGWREVVLERRYLDGLAREWEIVERP